MNPGPVEEAGKVATGVIEGLKSSPLLLGLLVLNAMGIGAAVWFLSKLAEAQGHRFEALMAACIPLLKP